VDVQIVPGNHATMVYQPNVQILAEKMAACIDRVQRDVDCVADRIEPSQELTKDSQ